MSKSDNTENKQSKPWLFKSGQSGNPNGRPKGARNKLSEDFLSDMLETWGEGGIAAIRQTMADRPHEYVKIVASLLPKETNLNVNNNLDEMSDEQLMRRLQGLIALAQPLLQEMENNGDDAGTTRIHH